MPPRDPPSRTPFPQMAGPHAQAWHTDPLQGPECGKAMRFIALIEVPVAIEKILRHVNLWRGPATLSPARPPLTTPGRGEVSEIPSSARDGAFLIESSLMPDYENVLIV